MELKSEYEYLNGREFETLVQAGLAFRNLEDYYRYLSSQEWVLAISAKAEILHLLKTHYPEKIKELLARAEQVSENCFDILGSGPTYLGAKVDWHLDFKSGRIWKKDFYLSVPVVFWGDYSDAKVPWELSRFQYATDLAIAYGLTGLKKHILKFTALVEDWIYENPCAFGINWVNPMDASIRALNWLAAYQLFGESLFSINFKSKFFRLLYQHGSFIKENLESSYDGFSDSYGTFNLIGLLVLGRLFGHLPAGKEWHQYAKAKLTQEIFTQIGSDGICLESSLNCQLILIELYLFAYLCENRFGEPFEEEFKERLGQACKAVYHLARPDETVPNLGDGGSDKLFKLDRRDEREVGYLFDLASVIIDLRGYGSSSLRPELELLWWTGPSGFHKYFDQRVIHNQRKSSSLFPSAGLAVLQNDESYLGFFANPISKDRLGTYKHNDSLAIEFSYGRENFITDSGTYVYTGDPAGRNFFRKTSSHSTLEVDGQEINRFLPKILFSVRRDAELEQLAWESAQEHDFIASEHSGYSRLENPIIARRSIHFDKVGGIYLFKDEFLGSGKHVFTGNHILDSGIKSRIIKNQIILLSPRGKMAVIVLATQNWYLEKIPHYISRSYGSKEPTWKIRYSTVGKAPQTCLWCIFGAETISQIENKMAIYYQNLDKLGWAGGSFSRLVLKREPETVLPDRSVRELFEPSLKQLQEEMI